MTQLRLRVVFLTCIFLFALTLAKPPTGLNLGSIRARRDIYCGDHLQYPHGNICCLNCPAGTHLKSHCTRNGQMGQCEECDYGSFTEHPNRLEQCFKCTQCRSDQEVVTPCTHTQDTECRCKPGRFCAHEEACEVCMKCKSCGKDEVIARNCTSTTNTQCKKTQPSHGSYSAKALAIGLPFLIIVIIIIIIAFIIYRRHCRKTDLERDQSDGMKAGQNYTACLTEERRNGQTQRPSCSSLSLTQQLVRVMSSTRIEDECQGLCSNSLNSSASNSQHSLTGLPATAFPVPAPRPSPLVLMQPNRREVEAFPMLVPENGEESLRKCFGYFEEMDVDYHKRFFRYLEIDNVDNQLKNTAGLPYEDKIHELLNIWVEQKGREASLNDLLRALFDLNQRRTAEIIKENAIRDGHYSLAK